MLKLRRGSGDSLLIVILLLAAGYWYFIMGAPGLTQNSVVNTVTITYIDGSTASFDNPSLVPNVITQVGGTAAIASIRYDTKVTPSFTGTGVTTVSGVTWTVIGKVESGKTGATLTKRMDVGPAANLPTSLTHGVQVTVSSVTITEAQLAVWVPLDYSGYDIKVTTDVLATFTPPLQSTPSSLSGLASSIVAVKNAGFPATLTVTISPTVTPK